MAVEKWHYYADQFDSRETGEHGWRKAEFLPRRYLDRDSTHRVGSRCHKLCVKGLWPIPSELVTLSPPENAGPFGFTSGEFACAWYVTQNGRVFKLIRHHGRTANLVVEIEYKEHRPYSWIPNYPKARVWDWVGVQTRGGY